MYPLAPAPHIAGHHIIMIREITLLGYALYQGK